MQQQQQHEQQHPRKQDHSSLSRHLSNSNTKFHRRIFLIRHGETDWNKQGKLQGGSVDIALNSKGKQQATQLANELHNTGTKFDFIVSSHLQRACQTADALSQLTSIPISALSGDENKEKTTTLQPRRIIYEGFREMDYGIHEGLPIKGPDSTPQTIKTFESYKNPIMKGDMDIKWPDGESMRHVEQRAVEALQKVLEQSSTPAEEGRAGEGYEINKDDRPKTIAIVAHAILNRVLLAATLQGDGKHFVDYPQDNCCINVIDQLPDGSYEAVVVNYNEHTQIANS